jgi:hypothetical protein
MAAGTSAACTAGGSSSGLEPRHPPHPSERDPPTRVESDALALQEPPLDQLTAGQRAETYCTARVHHPVPGDSGLVRQGVECVANLAGVTRETREGGDLAVRRDASLGDPADYGIDSLVAARAHWN